MQIGLRGLFATEASIHHAMQSQRAKTSDLTHVCLR
jgi:hypothetical protein